MEAHYDIIVIGSGPGGYVAAIRAAQLGMKVACIDKEKVFGGTCLRIGCIPSKALLEASEHFYQAKHHLGAFGVKVGGVELDLPRMMAHKDDVVTANTRGVAGLFQKNKVDGITGKARIASPGVVVVTAPEGAQTELTGDHIIVATGSVPASIPGVELDGDRVGTSDEALSYPDVPKRLVIIGAGAIGLEMGSVWGRLGAEIVVLEYLPRILPAVDAEVAKETLKILRGQGMDIRLGCKVTSAKSMGDKAVVTYSSDKDEAETLEADRVLVAVGRRPFTEGLGLEDLGVRISRRGQIEVDDHFETNVAGVYAIGDAIRGPMLAHKASEEGVALVERIETGYGHVNYDAIPNGVYTDPEVGAVGKTEEELVEAGVPFKKGKFPFRFNGRARALLSTEGFVKVLAHAETDRILGVHAVGPRACDLIAEAALAIEMQASAEDLGRTTHNHPTLSEVVKEAALAAWDQPIHM